MSRPIKLRAWDKQRAQWFPIRNAMCLVINPESTDLVFMTQQGPYPIPETVQPDGGMNRFILSQFTGLTLNGQDIYEGDILNTKAARWEVVFEHGAFAAKWLMGAGDPDLRHILWPMMEYAILLGNRYEHPELLTSPFALEGSR